MGDSPSRAYDGDDRSPARALLPRFPRERRLTGFPRVERRLPGAGRLGDPSRRGPAATPAGRNTDVSGPARFASRT